MICLASGIFGRPAWDTAKCAEHAGYVMEAADRHNLDPVLLVSINIVECDMQEKDNPVYQTIGNRKKLIGFDACPMGVRILSVERRQRYDARGLYELAGAKLEKWKSWCAKSHGRKHHFMVHYNEGNPVYAAQVLGVFATLKLRHVKSESLTPRTAEIIRRLVRVFTRGWMEPKS
jgi:hypothetical protein